MGRAHRNRQQPLTIEVPEPSTDRFRLSRVGLIAVGGFVVGVAWPGLAHIDLVPSPPGSHAEKAPAGSSSAPSPVPKPAPSATADSKQPSSSVGIAVKSVQITSCEDAQGVPQQSCDQVELGSTFEETLLALSTCEAARDADGVVSLGFDIDFGVSKLFHFASGQSTTVAESLVDGLIACAEKALTDVSLHGIRHRYDKYRVYYLVEFTPSTKEAAEPEAQQQVVGASGRAVVTWEVALIREQPRDGAIMARILGGTRLVVTGRSGDWYRVKYDAKGSEGWVFRAAIGL